MLIKNSLSFLIMILFYSNALFAEDKLSPATESYYELNLNDFKQAINNLNSSIDDCQVSSKEKFSVNYQLGPEELKLIAKNEYGTLKLNQLDEILKNDKEKKSYFIPIELSDKESLGLLMAGSLGFVLFKNDDHLMNFIQDHKTKVTPKISKLGDLYGATLVPAIAAGSYILGAVKKDDKLEKFGLYSVGALASQSLILAAIKTGFGRARPYQELGPNSFGNDGLKDKNQSFYSGHTAFAFTLATVADEVYGKDKPIVPYVAYGMAALTAWSRTHDKKHWVSDVFVGAVAGKGLTTLYLNAVKGNQDGRGGFKITPLIGGADGKFAIMAEWSEAEKNTIKACKKSLEECMAIALAKK
ncbi:MAG: phosphatase PAP2 family protein [Bdellovibrionales bacterium]|nr:phosphatase PAP2 family protein [Bdellovibrionales bacterium]